MKSNIGIGFRRDIADELIQLSANDISFIEVAPENWMQIGGYWKKKLKEATEKHALNCHSLSLSIGSPDALDIDFLKQLKLFLEEYNVNIYSAHLSYSKCDNAHLYDLMPIPFREDAVKHIVSKIKQAQDILERKIAFENVSYYTPVAAEMDEATFISSILNEADCNLLLDVNNCYVNGFNHNYNPKEFISKLPLNRVAYMHIAGHTKVDEETIIDTHGEPVINEVFDLFEWVVPKLNAVPVLLERDFNIPEINELMEEVNQLKSLSNHKWNSTNVSK